jgi:GNAT superfamily N-acetyltransferase
LARREIVGELGGMTWDDDGAIWWVALDGAKVAGFCALMRDGERVQLRSSYVLPRYRRRGVYRLLFTERMTEISSPARVRSVVRAEAVPVFRAHGFEEIKATKNFYTMELWV